MIRMKWKAYNQLAWTDSILNCPEDYSEEVEKYISAIRNHSKRESKTMLHLGCGAGMYDYTFKKHFKVTGVDISRGMLKVAHSLNPDIRYKRGDMRSFRIAEAFDTVIIPDSIGYMLALQDLRKTVLNAGRLLKPGGVLLIVAHTQEEFQENNFVYSGTKNGVHVTVFENNFILNSQKTNYEAAVTYVIRKKGHTRFYHECHTIGLFPRAVWIDLFKGAGFEVNETKITDLYDRYLMEKGQYTMSVFTCLKPLD